jgi:hypothetical protein
MAMMLPKVWTWHATHAHAGNNAVAVLALPLRRPLRQPPNHSVRSPLTPHTTTGMCDACIPITVVVMLSLITERSAWLCEHAYTRGA